MNWSIRIISTLVLFTCIVSCKKDSGSDANKTRLSRIEMFFKDPAQGNINYEFVYDDQKRVSEIIASNDQIKLTIFKCFYNGNDTNPYKTTGATAYAINYKGEIYHTYNSSGDIIQDSIPPDPISGTKIVRDYSYYTDRIVVQTRERSSIYASTFRDSFLLAGNNIKEAFVKIDLFMTQYNGYKLTYDNKINPISKLNIATLLTTGDLRGFPSYLAPGFCKNNISEYIAGFSNGTGTFTGQNTFKYNYTYNSNNLPEECRYAYFSGTYVIKYFYTD